MDQNDQELEDQKEDKPWDNSFKRLVRLAPQAFAELVRKYAHLELPTDWTELPHNLKVWKLEVDGLLEAETEKGKVLIHLECQSSADTTMKERTLRSERHVPVISCVIYLFDITDEDPSSLTWDFQGWKYLHFDFLVIELSKLTPEDLLVLGESGLFPLLPFTKGGTTPETTEVMLTRLAELENKEFLSLGASFSTLLFQRKNPAMLDWLIRRLRQMQDLLKESPLIQEFLEEGRQKGIEEGILKGLREMLLTLLQRRFPQLVLEAKELTALIQDPMVLQNLILNISMAQTLEEAQKYLHEVSKQDSH